MLSPPPKLYLYSCGWSDAPNHIENISGGLVFDIGKVARDYDSYVRRWLFFGGEGGIIDKQLSRSKALNDLLDLLQSFCARFVNGLKSNPSVPTMIVSVICNHGKHRSRWLIVRLREWLADWHSKEDSLIQVVHLSDFNRTQELEHYRKRCSEGYTQQEAIKSARGMGLRWKHRDFESIRWRVYWSMVRMGHHNHWIDMHRYSADAGLLDWCLDCLPLRTASSSKGAEVSDAPSTCSTDRSLDIFYRVAIGQPRAGTQTTSPQGACAGRYKHASWGSSVPRHKARKRFEVPDKRGTSPQPGHLERRGPRGPPTSASRPQRGNGQAFPGRRTGSRQGGQPEGGGLVGRRTCGQGRPGEGSTLDTQAG